MHVYSINIALQNNLSRTTNNPRKAQLLVNGKKITTENEVPNKALNDMVRNQSNKNILQSGTPSKQQLMEQALKKLQESLYGEDSEERYQAVLKKANEGEELSDKDLAYLKMKNPRLYAEIKSEEMFEKHFEESLKHCKTKEEAQDTYVMTMHSAERISGIKNSNKFNEAKYKRLMKRIQKVWNKYKKGGLGKDKKASSSTVMMKNKLIEEKIEVFARFQAMYDDKMIYNEQM